MHKIPLSQNFENIGLLAFPSLWACFLVLYGKSVFELDWRGIFGDDTEQQYT